jgi:ABC-2 type transport system ATP-binding protein
MTHILEFKDVQRAYVRGVDVLRGVSLTLERGEVVGLLGRNGAGKTTLLRIALGLLRAQRGTVRIFGLDPRGHPLAIKRRVGYVSEEQILPPFQSVSEAFALHRRLFPTWDKDLAAELSARFGLPARQRIGTLSKGQARQLALVCAAGHRPELLLLDEPAGGLDPLMRRAFLEAAIELLNEEGTTILFSSHYLFDVERLAGRVVMLHEGSVLLDSPLDDLRERYALALIPQRAGMTREHLRALEGCLAVRDRGDVWHAVFQLDAGRAETVVQQGLGVSGARCRAVALEEMYIELLGGQL